MITVSYWGKDCFGHDCYREDSVEHETEHDIWAAYKVLKAAYAHSMYGQDRAVWWDSIDDYQNLLITERVFTSTNEWDDRKVQLLKLRREWINRLNGKEVIE